MGESYTHIRINYNNSNQSDTRHTLPNSAQAPAVNPSASSAALPASERTMPMSASHSTTMSPTSHVTIKMPDAGVNLSYNLTYPVPTLSHPTTTTPTAHPTTTTPTAHPTTTTPTAHPTTTTPTAHPTTTTPTAHPATTTSTAHPITTTSTAHPTTTSPISHVKIKIPGSNVDLDYTLIIDRTPTSSQPAVTPQEALFLPRSDESKQIVELINDYARGGYSYGVNNKPSYTIAKAAEQISRANSTWNGKNILGKYAEITYSFYDWGQANEPGSNQMVGLSALQQQQILLALQSWADVANITFTYKSARDSQTNLDFGNFNKPKGQAFAYLPNSGVLAGQCWFNVQNHSENLYPENGNYGRHTFTHEIGHSLGLYHPGEYNAQEGVKITYLFDASYKEDSRQFSVMSYWPEGATGAYFHGLYAAAPMMDDISAMQRLYGPNMDTRTGDTIYGFNSNADRDYYSTNDARIGLVCCIWDAGGNDTLDFSGYYQNQRINLKSGTFSDVGGLKADFSIAAGVVIENVIGGKGNDIIVGNDADNHIKGGAGSDNIYGGLGADRLWGDGVNPQSIRFTRAIESIGVKKLNFGSLSSEELQSIEREITLFDPVSAVGIIGSEADQSTTQQQAAQPITQQRVDRQTVVNNYEIIEKDYFVYHSAKESTPSAYDLIMGFQGGIDKIDLASMKISNKAQNRDSTYVVDHCSNTVGKIEVMNYSDNIHRIFIKGDNYSDGDFMLDILGSFIPKTDIVIW